MKALRMYLTDAVEQGLRVFTKITPCVTFGALTKRRIYHPHRPLPPPTAPISLFWSLATGNYKEHKVP